MVVKPGAVLLALLVAAGCGGSPAKARQSDDPPGKVALAALCPGAHQVYDALVASNPESQAQFVDHLTDLRTVADGDARHSLDPVIKAAKDLEDAGRGPNFSAAQDGVYQAVVGLDEDCRTAGSFILH